VPRVASALILYLLATVLSIVWLNELGDTIVWVALIPQALGCLALGWWIREWAWTVVALAFLPTVLAGPFGNAENIRGEGLPIALFELLLMPAYLGLILGAFAARRALDRRRAARAHPHAPGSGCGD
jgi:hypothetical protein